MARPLAPSTSACLHSKESMSKGVQDRDHLESILHSVGLSKKHTINFIPSEELLVIGLIAEGVWGPIYKVEWKGISYAQKIFQGAHDTLGENYFETISKLFHKNIVTFMGYSVTSNYEISIIMELQAMNLSMALGSRRFGAKPHLDIRKRWRIVREIAEGMKYLHDQGVVHGDLKPSNVVVSTVDAMDTDDMVVKLIDFANAPIVLTHPYAAPEILKSKEWSTIDVKKVDVYSFGILCQEVLGGAPYFEDYHPTKYRDAILMGKRPPIPIGTSPEMKCLIKSCWNGDPQKRPTFFEVCKRLSGSPHYHSCLGHTCQDHFLLGCFF